jgi:ribonuclease Z
MFELLFLGTAAAVPAPERGLPCVHVTAGRDRFLIDCGEGTQRQLMRAQAGFRGLRAVLLTHAHLDHVLGLAGLVATIELFDAAPALDILGSAETIAFVRDYLAVTIGPEREGGRYRLRSIMPGPVLSRPGWHLAAFPVQHRGTQSLGYLFEAEAHRPLLPERLAALGVPSGPERRELAEGRPVVLADGSRVTPEMVRGPSQPGVKLAVVGDAGETGSLAAPVTGADALVIEATYLERDAALAQARGHLTAAAAAGLARAAGVAELLLTHISGRYDPAEILAEARGHFAPVRVIADFDRLAVDRHKPAALDAPALSGDNPPPPKEPRRR